MYALKAILCRTYSDLLKKSSPWEESETYKASDNIILTVLIPIQNENDHNSEAENPTLKGVNLNYFAQLHIR